MRTALRKSVPVLSTLVLNPVTLWVLGAVNRIVGRPVKTVFVCYPASPDYGVHVCFRPLLSCFRARPAITGVFKQGAGFGLTVAIGATEAEFRTELLALIRNRAERLRDVLGAERVTYAGILPTELLRHRLISANEVRVGADLVAALVCRAVDGMATELEHRGKEIVVIGSAGTVGRRLMALLSQSDRVITGVDRDDSMPQSTRSGSAIVVNCGRAGVLEARLDSLGPGTVVLNEAYPEPSTSALEVLKNRGVVVWHIAGLKAWAFPAFPRAYDGALPACAVVDDGTALTPMLRRLV